MDIIENEPGNRSQRSATPTTGNDTGHASQGDEPAVPLPADDPSPVEEELWDVEANNSVSSEYPQDRSSLGADDPRAQLQIGERLESPPEPRNAPESDPESGA